MLHEIHEDISLRLQRQPELCKTVLKSLHFFWFHCAANGASEIFTNVKNHEKMEGVTVYGKTRYAKFAFNP